MTDKLEPCRAMVNGKFCGTPPRYNEDEYFVCPSKDCDAFTKEDFADGWNTLQLDRLDAARWRELCGRGLVSKAYVDEIDAAINQPPKGGSDGNGITPPQTNLKDDEPCKQ